jgi:chromosome segregation ATPase
VSKEDDAGPENEGELLRWARETQRNIDFIVRQQAQFSADIERLREMQERSEQRWERSEQRWERTERRWERTEESVRSLHAIAQIHEREITALAEAQARTASQMAETDERINALVNTVEQLISERRNGGGRKEENSE